VLKVSEQKKKYDKLKDAIDYLEKLKFSLIERRKETLKNLGTETVEEAEIALKEWKETRAKWERILDKKIEKLREQVEKSTKQIERIVDTDSE